ncbi:MAG: putative DNA polymerase [Prokaryotic dsDNA virus sp.]|nr:MAG: putative DNA polymerase [Prokaryotic dsDNA virus sp.]|tara:strand:- start:7073 stop:8551 length:1479 start_codon:yes stop_codon:yes gene_type:complete
MGKSFTTRDGYQLLHDGCVELSRIEHTGIRVDRGQLKKNKSELAEAIEDTKNNMHNSGVWRTWRKRFGKNSNLNSRKQFSEVLDSMGYVIEARTAKGAPKMDEESLSNLDIPFVRDFVDLMKFEKTMNTYILAIERGLDTRSRLHPVFNLHTVQTYRSSSDSPNFQNMPVRDKRLADYIRTLFVASPGCLLLENDFKGIEVSVSACYHKDPNFISYITTPGKDMHRDMAAQLYMLEPGDVSKEARYGAKNKFVFPQFYGDYYVSCARSLWDWIGKGELKGPDGQPLKKHLQKKGIRKLGACNPDERPVSGTFEKHVQKVENDFWNNRFMQYGRWKKDWFQQYLRKGYFDMLSGFRVLGDYNRKQVCNYPVQGSAFHCLLWSLIQVNRKLRKYKMRSRIVGQIHDSMISDVRIEELHNFLCIMDETTTVELRKHFQWLSVPLEIECEVCPEGGSWNDKREVVFKDRAFEIPGSPGKFTRRQDRFLSKLNQSNK